MSKLVYCECGHTSTLHLKLWMPPIVMGRAKRPPSRGACQYCGCERFKRKQEFELLVRQAQAKAKLPAKKLKHAQEKLKNAQRKLKLAQSIVKRWQRRVKLYGTLSKKSKV